MSLWKLIILLPKIVEALLRLQQLVKDYDLEKWLKDLDVAIEKAEVANDSATRMQSAIDIANVISKLR